LTDALPVKVKSITGLQMINVLPEKINFNALVIFGPKLNDLVTFSGKYFRLTVFSLVILLFLSCLVTCKDVPAGKRPDIITGKVVSSLLEPDDNVSKSDYSILVSPENPSPGKQFRIIAAGRGNLKRAELIVSGPAGILKPDAKEIGEGNPGWIIVSYSGSIEGSYRTKLISGDKEVINLEFTISQSKKAIGSKGIWKTRKGWDRNMEILYSAWINSLFKGCDEQASWPALHGVTQDRGRNFLYNHLSLDEDDCAGKFKVIMQPDCADNPFFLRAYFAWKLGLPFGYHVSDRGSLNRCPGTGQWITNENTSSKSHPVLAFNSFLRKVMDGVHSGTARAALDNENSDYYPVSLERNSLRPGTVYADPYGHTLTIVEWIPQTHRRPGLLLAVDAQPDGTIAIKRFWKGNFLFNTTGVVGEPGFKAFRPINLHNGTLRPLRNKELTESEGFVPYSLQQRKMGNDIFYDNMERLINPEPLDPEAELLDLIQALHEQLLVRVTSVTNGEAYMKSHPGTVIGMPSGAAAIFQAGGQWEAYSTPNRDLRLLIAIDEVLNFPDKVAGSPGDYKLSGLTSTEQTRKKLQEILEDKASELSISYTRSDGSLQKLTIAEILGRREAFEMAYNPNDGIEIRWGAPEKSQERASCCRRAPSYQLATMEKVRKWFHSRMHPPT
jgi:hypothetical protein